MQKNHRNLHRRTVLALAIAAAAIGSMPSGAWAQATTVSLADRLTPAQLTAYETYRAARDLFERQLKTAEPERRFSGHGRTSGPQVRGGWCASCLANTGGWFGTMGPPTSGVGCYVLCMSLRR